MAYVITAACIDVTDRSCVAECPVDCVYEGRRKLYIHPEECIDCGACALVCPVDAIVWDRDPGGDPSADPSGDPGATHLADAHVFFFQALPGRTSPIGSPGGATGLGPLGVDTPLVDAVRRPGTPDSAR
ncbi:Ferredoxin [Frankia sp. AiPs1]|uniref:indolepyruvate ferredoxin oxidoreductase subunit alpha n=1 Tax=Frankia sp. AiPa1 TaxID=573492 RepID=UPI00202B0230|nr:ferredoxin family protein [Frankia sp. AiPa1]MCL9762449.1 ferredoxin family protein [Frankia sp. AiPa1]